MLKKYIFFILSFLFMVILLKRNCLEKFTDINIEFSKRETRCEECCNQLQSNSECYKKCIFDGDVCRCCTNIS